MKINVIEKILGSGFFSGYIPFASGTFGSLVAILLYLIPGFENPTFMGIIILITFVAGIPIGSKFEMQYGKDPAQCTLDEVVGTWITLLFVPKEFFYILTAFLIWRLLDIIKPFPANRAEKLNGGLGIMLDDVIAGAYSLVIVHILIYFIT